MSELPCNPEALAKRRELFLQLLASNGGNVIKACRAVGYTSSSAMRALRESDPEFARRWDEAVEASNDVLEAHAIERATVGVEKAVWFQGEVVGTERVASDGLLNTMLKARMRDKYADRKEIGVTGTVHHKVGVAIIPMLAPSVEDWERTAITHATPAPVALPAPKNDGE